MITDHEAEIARLTAALAQSRVETQAALAGPIRDITKTDLGNIIAHLSYECEPRGELPNRNSLMMEIIRLNNRLAAIQPDTSKLALVRETLRFYAGCYEPELSNPNSGPWGANSTDFGEKARAALALITAQEEPRHD